MVSEREILIQRLNLYLKAERDVTLHGQTVELEGMRITRASLMDLRKEIANLKNDLAKLDAKSSTKTKSRIRVIVPV
jgi:hypothetical protein